MSTLIIAEAGVNHNGDLDKAKQLVDVAAAAGADLVKFQTFSADRLASASAPKAQYQAQATGATESQRDMLRRLELSAQEHTDLLAHCHTRGIGFFSTGFDIECVELLVKLGLTLFKVPSGEITNLPYLRHIGGLRGEVLLSTGMSCLGEVEAALEALERSGTPRQRVTVLHCTTEYPTPMLAVNLHAMAAMGNALGVRFGYSDHTDGIEVAVAAVALGASVIEKHVTLDRNLPGPDHKASLEPDQFKAMVTAIRNVELALGDGIKRCTAGEMSNVAVARKSLVAIQPITAGEIFEPTNVSAMRPGTGISPMRWDEVMGRTAQRNFLPGDLIEI